MQEPQKEKSGFLKNIFTTKAGSSALLAAGVAATTFITGATIGAVYKSYPDLSEMGEYALIGGLGITIATSHLSNCVKLVKDVFEVETLKELAGRASEKYDEFTSTKLGFATEIVAGLVAMEAVDSMPDLTGTFGNAVEFTALAVTVGLIGHGAYKGYKSYKEDNDTPKPPTL